MAKLLKLRRGSTSQHSSFTGAEGEVTIDTTKDTAVVHDGSTQSGRPLAREDMNNVSSASIVGRIGTSALAGTKVSPNFGSQNITTTGNFGAASVNITDTSPSLIFTDSAANSDYRLRVQSGVLKLRDDTNSADRLTIASDGTTTIAQNLDVGAGLDVTGDLAVTGSIAASNIDANAGLDISIASGTTSAVFGSSSQVNGIQNLPSASGTPFVVGQDTGSLRSAIFGGNVDINAGLDVTGNITVTGTVDGRDVASDGSKLDGIESGATADQSASEILTLLKTVDGGGSGLDSDFLDGVSSGSFVRSDADDTLNGQYTISDSADIKLTLSGSSDPKIQFQESTTNKAFIQWHSGGYLRIQNQEDGSILKIQDDLVFSSDDGSNFYKVWHAGNDGTGSGLDADRLQNLGAGDFLRRNAATTTTGDVTFSGGAGAITVSAGSDIRMAAGTWTGEQGGKIQYHSNNLYHQATTQNVFRNANGTNTCTIDNSGNLVATGNVTAFSDARLKTEIHTINDALGICGKLRGVNYKWLADGKPSIGVIAQEVEEVVPEVVLTNQDVNPVTQEITEVKSVDYGKLVGVLINAVNELKAELDAHKAECAKLHGGE